MATAQQFEDLQVWQDARCLVKQVYELTKQRLFRRDFGLHDQITRAATSTMSNIAEGFERGSRKEFIQFLNIAKGSNGEVRSQLYAALDQESTKRHSCHYAKQRSCCRVALQDSLGISGVIPMNPAESGNATVERTCNL